MQFNEKKSVNYNKVWFRTFRILFQYHFSFTCVKLDEGKLTKTHGPSQNSTRFAFVYSLCFIDPEYFFGFCWLSEILLFYSVFVFIICFNLMLRKDEEKVQGYNLKCASRRMWKKQKYTYKTQFSQQETVQYTVTFLHRKNHLFVNSLTRREQKHHTLKLSDMNQSWPHSNPLVITQNVNN